MLERNIKITLIFFGVLLSTNFANAGLYGFSSANPYTLEEEILQISIPPLSIKNYRQEMRDNITILSNYAKQRNQNFQVITHEGQDLLQKGLWEFHLDGYNQARQSDLDIEDPTFLTRLNQKTLPDFITNTPKSKKYIKSLNAIAINNVFCNNTSLPKNTGLKVINIESCNSKQALQNSLDNNMIFYNAKNNKDFNTTKYYNINENAKNVFTINDAKNINIILDEQKYNNKESFIKDIRNTNFDTIIINPLFHDKVPFTAKEIHSMKFKKNGTQRLVLAQMNISEANQNLYYWDKYNKVSTPAWIKRASFVDKDNFIVEYWNQEWKDIISKHLKGIVDTNYDGVFFTGLNNYDYFEKQTPLD